MFPCDYLMNAMFVQATAVADLVYMINMQPSPHFLAQVYHVHLKDQSDLSGMLYQGEKQMEFLCFMRLILRLHNWQEQKATI